MEMKFIVWMCYTSVTLEFFNVTVKNGHPICIFLPVVFDGLYILHMCGKFYTHYYDKHGLLITDPSLIQRRYLRGEFALDLMSVFPLESLSFAFRDKGHRLTAYNYFKVNRFLRIYFMYRYLSTKSKTLNINVYWIRSISVIMWITLMVQVSRT